MRIFYSFLIIVCSTILILLPVSSGIYAFRTDARTDQFTVLTATGTTNATVQLLKPIYDDDTSTIELSTNDVDDEPYWSSYNSTNRGLVIIGLAGNTTRTIDVTYDIDVIGTGAMSTFMDVLPWTWILIWIAFPIAALIAIWSGRAR